MTRYAFYLAALVPLAALAAPANAQSLCDLPAAQLTAAQLETCRSSSVLVVPRPQVENHRDGLTILRGQ
jgi:hypothetical protein